MSGELDLSALPSSFPGILVAEPDGTPARLVDVTEADLGMGDVLIQVAYSSLNYKDGLALTGSAPIVRSFPMIGGIDIAGRVIASASELVQVGDSVIATGWGIGESHPGGYCAYARVPGEWCVKLEPSMSLRSAAIIGTAGFTAMLSLMALERNRSRAVDLGDLPLVVTGASGGVGSFAVLLGALLGYRVVASTGKTAEAEFLRSLGAEEVIDRAVLSEADARALGRVRFGAGIDSVGGTTLANVIRMIRQDGMVTACGLAGGAELALTVHPFILRGITLAGINSVYPLVEDRAHAWEGLEMWMGEDDLAMIGQEIALADVIRAAPTILRGEVRGRLIVAVE